MSTEKRGELPEDYQHWWSEIAGHLGAVYPFQDSGAPAACSLDIGTIIEARRARGEVVKLDPVGLVGKATRSYLLGNRTLLKDIRRAPWMARPDGQGEWHSLPLPPHDHQRPEPGVFVEELKSALVSEARGYVRDARTVGILLSGGMDSRVLAGVVRALQEESGHAFLVVGLTWGRETSRDVIYARRITDRFGWDWRHFPIDSQTLFDNIGHMARMGAETSPLHLHAMPDVARMEGVDAVLAGSYGDMVGRAEFSGKHVTQLTPMISGRNDPFGVLRTSVIRATGEGLQADAEDTVHLKGENSSLRCREIEQHCHYTRRMLQSCMLSIASEKPFYQLFTSPEVFGRMWALDATVRDDAWYARLLPRLPGNLLDIPWARTGRRYDRPDGAPDEYSRQHHAYGTWLRGELRDDVLRRASSDRIRALGIFNEWGLEQALKTWAKAGTASTNSLDELVAWLATLHDFMETYRIEPDTPIAEPSWKDAMSALRGKVYGNVYIGARERLRD